MAEKPKSDGTAQHDEKIETISTPAGDQQQNVQIQVDDAQTPVTYSSTVRVWGSAEEINLDFAGPLRPTGPKSARLKIDQRMVLNPWAAKRLCLAMNQAIARYEKAYGTLEIDPRKRLANPAAAAAAQQQVAPPAGKLS